MIDLNPLLEITLLLILVTITVPAIVVIIMMVQMFRVRPILIVMFTIITAVAG